MNGGSIEIESGVSPFTGKGFCQIRVDGKPVGQLDPEQVRTMALHWLAAADAAESDAAVFAEMKTLGLEDKTIGGFISALRERRVQ